MSCASRGSVIKAEGREKGFRKHWKMGRVQFLGLRRHPVEHGAVLPGMVHHGRGIAQDACGRGSMVGNAGDGLGKQGTVNKIDDDE